MSYSNKDLEENNFGASFEFWRKRIGLILAPVIFTILYLLPIQQLNEQAHKLLAIVGLVVILWITEALPLAITGLLIPILVVVFEVTTTSQVFAPFADPVIFLFLGSFILSRAIYLHGLDKRFAYWILSNRFIGEHPGRILFAYGAICCCISMWINNTATAAMTFPIAVAIIRALNQNNNQTNKKFACSMVLMCSFAASVGGLATPVGTPTNLIGLGFIERQLLRKISFFEWMSFAVPIVIVLYLLLFLYLNFFCPAETATLKGISKHFANERTKLGKISVGERNTLIAFGITILLWVTPGGLALVLGDSHFIATAYSKRISESIAAIIGTCLLFILPINWKKRQFTLNVKQALEIDWEVVLLYGGGIALGQLVFSTGLAEIAGHNLVRLIPQNKGLLLLASCITTMVSELTSNASSSNMVVPVVIAIAGHNGLQASLASCMTASLGFMLPISTPSNAIVYSSGYIKLIDMIKYGFLLDLIGIVVIVCGVLLFAPAR